VATSSILLVAFLINPIGQTSQKQYVSAQENTIVSSYNNTSTNATFSSQTHNYTSSSPGPVNSWIIESNN
jgi:hypothetical protein